MTFLVELKAYWTAWGTMILALALVTVFVGPWGLLGLWLGFGLINFWLLRAWVWDPFQAAVLIMMGSIGLATAVSDAFD